MNHFNARLTVPFSPNFLLLDIRLRFSPPCRHAVASRHASPVSRFNSRRHHFFSFSGCPARTS